MGNVINVTFAAGTEADALCALLRRAATFTCGTLPQYEQDALLEVPFESFSKLTAWDGVSAPIPLQLTLSDSVTAPDREQIDQAVRLAARQLAQAAVKRALNHSAVVMQDCVTRALWIAHHHCAFPGDERQTP